MTKYKFFPAGLTMVLMLTATLSSQGCAVLLIGAAAAAGAGTVAYVKGSLEQNLDRSVAQVHRATLAGLKDLKYTVVEDRVKTHEARVKAEMINNESVTIEIEALTEITAKIKIRIGMFGNETKSQMVLNTIKKRL